MGRDVSNAGVAPHTSGGTRVFHMWAGIKVTTGGADQHESLGFSSTAQAKAFCVAAQTSKAAARAVLDTAQQAWFDALPTAFSDDLVTDAAKWAADGYCW